jgi:hypothetical protein
VKEFVLQSVLAVLLWMTVNERRIELCFPAFTMWPQAYRHFRNATDTLMEMGNSLPAPFRKTAASREIGN